ncbi:MAG TPA: glycosyltransferase family 4 protein [Chitinophagaceae bacterium]|nr:glycosyltransferase family 4 protein [Chitinophagaceae bacterium]
MARKRVLWLCSWYPRQADRYTGDFIQRHARAAALHHDIHVVHVALVDRNISLRGAEQKFVEGVDERIVYVKRSNSFAGRLLNHRRILQAYRKAVVEFVDQKGRPDLLHVHIPMKAGLAGLWAKKKYGVPMLVTEHWGIYNEVVEDRFSARGRMFRALTTKILAGADQFVSVSEFLVTALKNYVAVPEARIIPNTVDSRWFYYKERQPAPFRFIHVSNLAPLKNVQGILRAFSQVVHEKEAELVIVGNQDNRMEAFAAALGVPQGSVRFRGEVPYEQVAVEMQSSNCLVLFSQIENSPCVIPEAFCCGLPVIATTVGGIPELVNDRNGLLVAPVHEEKLAAAMKTMISHYQRYDRQRIAIDARAQFSFESVGRSFDKLYQ